MSPAWIRSACSVCMHVFLYDTVYDVAEMLCIGVWHMVYRCLSSRSYPIPALRMRCLQNGFVAQFPMLNWGAILVVKIHPRYSLVTKLYAIENKVPTGRKDDPWKTGFWSESAILSGSRYIYLHICIYYTPIHVHVCKLCMYLFFTSCVYLPVYNHWVRIHQPSSTKHF